MEILGAIAPALSQTSINGPTDRPDTDPMRPEAAMATPRCAAG